MPTAPPGAVAPARDFALERFFARHEFSVRHLLCASDCEALSVRELLALEPGAAEALQDVWLGYSESPGHPALRQQIAALYEHASAADVLVHVGAQEVIWNLARTALAPGDRVIVQTPCYQSLADAPRTFGCEVVGWPTREDLGWRPDLDELDDLLTPGTRAVVINQPHNPTGGLLDAAGFRRLFELADARGARVICDEVYRGLELDPADRLPAAADLNPEAVSIGVMSKSFGLAGLRIGWIATRNRALLARMAAAKDWTTICAAGPSELLATVALRHADQLVARNRAIVAQNLELLDAFFARHAERLRWTRPTSGPVTFPSLRDTAETGDAFVERLIAERGLLLAPGSLFGHHPQHFRLGFGRRSLPAGLQELDEALSGTGSPRARPHSS